MASSRKSRRNATGGAQYQPRSQRSTGGVQAPTTLTKVGFMGGVAKTDPLPKAHRAGGNRQFLPRRARSRGGMRTLY